MAEMVDCPSCGGHGVVWSCNEDGDEEESLCCRCNGSTEVTAEGAALPIEDVIEKYHK